MADTSDTGRPLISVIVPVYNAARYVGVAVRSALAVPEPVEVVLVEDGSKDRSLDVCRRLAARYPNVRLLRHPGGANRGASVARNVGIRAARGRYLAFLDADDFYLPNRFTMDVPILEGDPSLDGVYGAVGVQLDEGHVPIPGGDRSLITIDGRVAPGALFDVLLLGSRGTFHTPGITVRREVFERTGFFDPLLRQGQDSAMWLKMAAVCRLGPGSTRQPVAVYRRHDESRTRRHTAEWRDARCACVWSVLRWAHAQRLPERLIEKLRLGLALTIVGKREGTQFLPRVLRVVERAAAYGFQYPPLLFDLGLIAARKLTGRPRVGRLQSQPLRGRTSDHVQFPEAEDATRVSVVIPVYNAEDYIAAAVESVLGLPQDLEVVLVEDGSKDGTLAVCRQLAARDPRVKLFRHEGGRNCGEAASRNLGIRAARGRYVAFLDADDLYLPNRFDVDVPILDADPAVDGVYAAVRTLFDEGAVPMPGGPREVTTLDGPVEPDELFATLLLGARGSFSVRGITVKRSAFERSGLFDERLVMATDSAMWLRLAATCRLVAGSIVQPVALWRRHSGNVTNIENPHWAEGGCAYVWSVLNWARARELDPIKQAQLRKGLALVMVDRRAGARLPGGVERVVGRILRYGWAYPAVLPELLWVFVKKLLGRPLCDYRNRTPAVRREGGA